MDRPVQARPEQGMLASEEMKNDIIVHFGRIFAFQVFRILRMPVVDWQQSNAFCERSHR